jgi:hypothetical protein
MVNKTGTAAPARFRWTRKQTAELKKLARQGMTMDDLVGQCEQMLNALDPSRRYKPQEIKAKIASIQSGCSIRKPRKTR